MGHMQPDIQEGYWLKVETNQGTSVIPADLVVTASFKLRENEIVSKDDQNFEILSGLAAPFVDGGDISEIHYVHGFGARLSAPGYMDQTDWTVFPTEKEAKDHIREFYDVCPECGDDISENECSCEQEEDNAEDDE